MGSQINNIIYSSAITGKDIETGKTAEGGQAQVRVAFANLRKFLDAADATPNDVIRLTVTLADFDLRQFIDEEWLQMFPDATSRPARHVSQLQAHHSEVAVELQVVVVTSN
jgi:2-iminobutanoate/2-iminopropanoate deaminase